MSRHFENSRKIKKPAVSTNEGSSASFKNGSLAHTSPEPSQAHKSIELSEADRPRISETFVDLYRKGLSLSDIAKQTGKAKNTIRESLIRSGVALRTNTPLPINEAAQTKGKGSIRPYYGICYFQGVIVPDPREYNLAYIHRQWKLGTNPNRIADLLNEKKVPPRSASTWNRNSIVNILKRFKDGVIVHENGLFELR